MDYSVSFERMNNVIFDFEDGECTPLDLCDGTPEFIKGTITLNEKKIGFLDIYELYNDSDFYSKCDNLSGDCEVIAATLCDESGSVLNKYLPTESEYEPVFILDKISIDTEYRKKGIGTNIIKHLLYMLKHQFGFGCAIILCASDYESADRFGFDSKEYLDGCKQLKSFYQKAGFSKVKDNIYIYKET